MNDKLYNDLLEWCNYDLEEVKRTIDYFSERLEQEIENEELESERFCNECGKAMNSGYCIDNGCEYYCSEECLHKHYTEEEFLEMYDNGNGDSYYTEWED